MTAATGRRGMELSGIELLGCWTVLNLGEPPAQLRLRAPGHTIEERDALLRHAVAGLAARGLADEVDPSRPHLRLAGMLRVIATAERHLDLWLHDRRGSSRPLFGLGAQAGRCGVVLAGPEPDPASGSDGVLRLIAMDSTHVAPTLLGLLGLGTSMRPGIGTSVNIPVDIFEAACRADTDGSLWSMAERLTSSGVTGHDARSLARMCGGIQVTGQLGATARTGEREQRGRWVIGMHRTEQGWYLQLRRDSTITVCPTDASRLMYQWHELINTLPPRR